MKRVLNGVLDFMTFGRNQLILAFRRLVPEQHQLTSTTSSDRYPELFTEVRSGVIQSGGELSILSFGCSTGEECFTLKSYFPTARVTGVDINRQNLRKARKKNTDADLRFLYSTPDNIMRHGKYDVIMALSVLCRWEDTKDVDDCRHIYSFSKFSETAEMLAGQLKPGGLLVIYNSNFRFEDTAVAKDFIIIPTPSVGNSGFVHKFDSSNRKTREVHRHCVYRKMVG